MCKYVKRFGLSRAHKVPPILYKVCWKTKFFVTLSWIWNKVKVKMKGMLHIYNDRTIDWHQVCENMWSGLGWVAHTKYHPSYIKYAGKQSFFVTLSWIWNKVTVKMKGMLHIYNDCTIDWHQICANMWSGFGWVAHTKYHPYSGRTDRRTNRRRDMNPMSPVRGIRPAGDNKAIKGNHRDWLEVILVV